MERLSTSLGILAILLWSSTIAVSRQTAQALGPLTSGTLVFLLGGAASCIPMIHRESGLMAVLHLPRRYLLGCGALFISYEVALYLSVGLSVTDQQVLVVGLINYLWPALILVTAIPILGYRASPWLVVGVILALAGVTLALGSGFTWKLDRGDAIFPYLLMLYGALAWALYTNLSRRWLGDSRTSGLPLFILGSGLALGILRAFAHENSQWSGVVIFRLAYLVVGVTWLAYTFWDIGTRQGNLLLLSTLSYFIPLLSTMISIILLSELAYPALWIAAGLLIAGAWVCKRSVRDRN